MTYLSKSYKISSIKTYTEDVKLFRIRSDLNPGPGQFLEVSIPGIGECPLASCSNDHKNIDLLTRRAGNVTSMMFNMKKGDNIFIRGPYGKGFPLEELKDHNLILVAGGTGIAPITSLIDHIEKNREMYKKITIFFGFKNEDYILLKEKIKSWKKRFSVHLCLDKSVTKEYNDPMDCKIGFVHDIIEQIEPETEDTIALLCGPEIMMHFVTKTLHRHGIKDDKIYWSMERRMECGFGNCNRCLIQDLYVCKDGPVFRYDIIKPRLENEDSNKED